MSRQSPVCLVADIGGTHARFALAEPSTCRPALREVCTLNTAQFSSLGQALRHYLDGLGVKPRRAALAVAAPVLGDEVHLTNCAWRFNRPELAATLRLDELKVINDFAACALGVSALKADECERLFGAATRGLLGPVSVIGPGTGMGMALLLHNSRRQWQVLETEGGHASFAPQDEEERQIGDWLAARHGRASIERVLSGAGLADIYAALSGQPADLATTPHEMLPTPATIVASALNGDDAIAHAALARFCAVLGSVAGDAALFHGARTLAIAGGMVPRFIPFLKSSAFRQHFFDKGRFGSYLERVKVLVITHPAPGLLGAAVSLDLAPPGDSLVS